jgi:hypothetical protein
MPYFGELDLTSLDDCYDTEIELEGRLIRLDLNFEHESIAAERMDMANKLLENLAKTNAANLAVIETGLEVEADFEGPGVVRTYIEHHLKVVDEKQLVKVIDWKNSNSSPAQQLRSKLLLVRVGLHPENTNDFAVFDYSIGEDITQYLIVMNLNERGELHHMTMES